MKSVTTTVNFQAKSDRNPLRLSAVGRILKHFLPHVKPHRFTLVMAGLCMLGVTFMELLKPWPLKFVFDVVLVSAEKASVVLESLPEFVHDTNTLLAAIASSILIIAVLSGLFGFGQAILLSGVGQKVVAAIRSQVYAHLQRLSHSFHEHSATGDLLARLTGDIRMLRELLVTSAMFVVDRSLAVVAMTVIMLWMDWQLTLVALAVMPVLVMTVTKFGRDIKGATRRQRRKESQITNVMAENLSSISIVQAFAREAYEEGRFARHNAKSMQAGLVSTRIEQKMNRLVQIILALGTAGVVWFGVTRVQHGVLTPGDLLVFTAYLTGLYKPIRKLASLTSRMAKATVCGERVVSILETESDITDSVDAYPAPRFRGEIDFQNVTFSYPVKSAVINQAQFHVESGETIALWGESGAGKSTIANLLLRFYDPDSGGIFIDGVDIRRYTLESLRNQIAVVLQESVLFNTSIRHNIGYGKLDADEDEIISVARAANAHEFIEQLPDGYDTVVSERGASLSGGQRQRIAIARAMIRKAPIVILDEPTAGLDINNKTEVEAALNRLVRNVTCLKITHDPITAASADRILKIEYGEIIDITKDFNEPSQRLPVIAYSR